MSKIICEICGTSYPETAESCPICGCTRDLSAEFEAETPAVEEAGMDIALEAAPAVASKKREIFDYDEVNPMHNNAPRKETVEVDEDDEEEEEESRSNALVIVILVILIAALLIGAGFIFVKFFLPNMRGEEPVPTTEAIVTEAPTTEAPTTEPTVPCTNLTLDVSNATLNEIGQNFLLNVSVKPEDTTDTLTYMSGDESIATVTEDGKITAVAEGETVIYITCGKVQVTCPVVVQLVPETEPATEATVPAEETVSETEPEETTAPPKDYDPSITLKLKKKDISLGLYLSYQLLLDCDLEQDDVEWSVEHNWICKVDEFGNVTALQHGVTDVIVKYGDQEVRCKVRI